MDPVTSIVVHATEGFESMKLREFVPPIAISIARRLMHGSSRFGCAGRVGEADHGAAVDHQTLPAPAIVDAICDVLQARAEAAQGATT